MMNKFSGPQDGSFQLVSGCIKQMFDNASIISIRTAEERECLQMLTSSYREDKDRNKKRVAHTCEWFLNHPKFDSWRKDKTANLLWVSADPGCWKSVLSKALVDEGLLRIDTRGPSTTCYFFFKDDDANRQHSANALCAILHQLFTQKPMLLKYAMPDFENNGQQLCTMSRTLWDILQKAAADPRAGDIMCVLDALDECQESTRENLIAWMGNFYSARNQIVTRMKFLVTSRPYYDIEGAFNSAVKDLSSISLRGKEESEKISKEINLVIDDVIPRISSERRYPLEPKVQSGLIDHLKSVGYRTYLWLHLILDVIRKTLDSTQTRLEKLVDTIPRTVNDAYEKILKRISDPEMARRARSLLSIVVVAARPLTLQEMNIAPSIDERLENGEQCRSLDDLDLEPEEPFSTKVRNLCGLFVSILDSKVYLIHQTAKEFLVSKKLVEQSASYVNDGLKPWKHSLNSIQSNVILAKICISVLNFNKFKHKVDEDGDQCADKETDMDDDGYYYEPDVEMSPKFAFLDYVAKHWVAHFHVVQHTVDQSFLRLAAGICDPSVRLFCELVQGLPKKP